MNRIQSGACVLFALVALFFFQSCAKFEDAYKPFVGDGEITYTARPDSLKAHSGLNRIQLDWLFTSDPSITKYKIYWNNRKDSIVRDFVRSNGVDTVRETIANLPEGVYVFEVFTYDNKGHSSVKSEVVARAYGNVYQNSLLPRAFRLTTRVKNDMIVTWAPASDDVRYTVITYTDMLGNQQEVNTPKEGSYAILPLFPQGGTFNYQSFYAPDTLSLDILNTPPIQQKFNVTLYTGWSQFDKIFGIDNELGVRTPGGAFYVFPFASGSNTFTPVTAATRTGWQNYVSLAAAADNEGNVIVKQANGAVITWKFYHPISAGMYYGNLVPYAAGTPVANEVMNWDINFGYKNKYMGVNKITGELRYYTPEYMIERTPPVPVRINALVNPQVITGVDWLKYNAIVPMTDLNFFYGRTANGNLYRISIDLTTNTASNETLVATGWDRYRIVSSFQNNLLGAEGNNLWFVPVKDNGTLDVPSPASYSETPAP